MFNSPPKRIAPEMPAELSKKLNNTDLEKHSVFEESTAAHISGLVLSLTYRAPP